MKFKDARKLTTITPYWRNPRINDVTVARLKESIAQFGFVTPIIVDTKGVIICGHARFKAATQLGLEEVPVIVSNMEEKIAQRFRIADNKVGESSEWDDALLMQELREIGDLGDLQKFFDDDLAKLLSDNLGHAVPVVTVTDVTRSTVKEHDRFKGGQKMDLVEVTCPHCGEAFNIRKDELLGKA